MFVSFCEYEKEYNKKIRKLHVLKFPDSLLLRMVGLEPTRGHPRKILSLVRLPFRHIRSQSKGYLLLFEPRFILS